MKLRTIAIASGIVLRIIATIHHCLIILISGTCLVGCVLGSRPGPPFGLPFGFSAIHLLAIWLPVQLIGSVLKMILRIIVTTVDCALILCAFLLFVVVNFVTLNIAESSLGQLVFTFFLILLLPIGFLVISILAIWIPVFVSPSATPVEQKESKQGD